MKRLYTDATTMPDSIMLESPELLAKLQNDYPEFSFEESARFSWHAGKRVVSYRKEALRTKNGAWALLHELGHALFDHTDYTNDIELLQMEVAAWEKARELCTYYGLPIDEDYVQDCLDSYRDWLHTRATCPTCFIRCLQKDTHSYLCHNCGTSWRVTRSRHCRPYRRKN